MPNWNWADERHERTQRPEFTADLSSINSSDAFQARPEGPRTEHTQPKALPACYRCRRPPPVGDAWPGLRCAGTVRILRSFVELRMLTHACWLACVRCTPLHACSPALTSHYAGRAHAHGRHTFRCVETPRLATSLLISTLSGRKPRAEQIKTVAFATTNT